MTQYTSLVTGVSRGIGRAIADTLAAQGHKVIGLSRTPPDNTFAGEFFPVDLADADETEKTLETVVSRHAVDNVINNAGLSIVASLEEIDLENLDQMINVNVRPMIQCVQACLPAMKGSGRGRIVNIGSRAALGKARQSVYGASKAAVSGLTRAWALELGQHGITVNCINPGPIDTEMFRDSNPADDPATQKIINGVLVKRLGKPEDIASTCAFLASDEAGFITGQTINVCGGLSVGMAPN